VPELNGGRGAAGGEEPLDALPAGFLLRSYEVVSVLGDGSFGITYLARDTTLSREVAIKEYLPAAMALRRGGATVVPRSTAMRDDFIYGRERFLEEARTLAKLENAPAVVRVIDYLEANGTAYMVMALVRGETLRHRILERGAVPADVIDRLVWPLLDGLEQVHATGFLHRDIKPSNVILDSRDRPTLIDFGAARVAVAHHMTAIYTPGYAAPEQFGSTRLGPSTDIYGLSATLYHAITGKRPPGGLERVQEDRYKPLAWLAPPGFEPGLLAGIDAGMAVRGADRPQSIAAWRELLRQKVVPRGDTMAVPRPPPAPTAAAPEPVSSMQRATSPRRPPAAPPPDARGWMGRWSTWIGIASAIMLAGAGSYVGVATVERHQEESRQAALEAKQKTEEPAAAAQKAREEAALKEKADAAEAARRRAEEEPRRKQAATAEAAGAMEGIDRAMREWIRQYGVKQASLAVLRDDRLVFSRGYGGRNVDDRINVWQQSSAITGVCVAALIGEGKLRLDDKLGQVLQPLHARIQKPADPRVNDIRIEDLLTQRSGWQRSGWHRNGSAKQFPDDGLAPGGLALLKRSPVTSATADMLVPQILSQPLAWAPGERFGLSDANYLMLGQVIETVAGSPYDLACDSRVLTKAGINRPQLDATWGRLLEASGGWSLSGPEYLAFLRLLRPRQPDLLTPGLRRWLWDGEGKWIDPGKQIAYSLGVMVHPVDQVLWNYGLWNWQPTGPKDGTTAITQATFAALGRDGTGLFASFDTIDVENNPLAMLALETALRGAIAEVKAWPEGDGFAERGIRAVSVP
jgi:serine/threonine protein kinase/CubicO group peptidase (beta-lactamase class C family)